LQGYTSRGTGASGLPVRLNCMPEVTLHVLRCAGR
jgi:predicted MPP superfamily phosphohydrolase